MLIDWFTVAAQIINFLILVGLLKYFFYDRIINAMDEREESIRLRFEKADQKKSEAENEANTFRDKQTKIEKEQDEILEGAKKDAEEEKNRLVKKAREEVDELEKKWQSQLKKEKDNFVRDFKMLASKEVIDIARKALRDLSDVEVEERTVSVFLDQLKEMKKKDLNDIVKSVKEEDPEKDKDKDRNQPVIIRSGFEMPSQMRQKITRAVHQHITEKVDVDYHTSPELLLGMELRIKGQKMSWNLAAYLDGLEESAAELFASYSGAEEDANS